MGLKANYLEITDNHHLITVSTQNKNVLVFYFMTAIKNLMTSQIFSACPVLPASAATTTTTTTTTAMTTAMTSQQLLAELHVEST